MVIQGSTHIRPIIYGNRHPLPHAVPFDRDTRRRTYRKDVRPRDAIPLEGETTNQRVDHSDQNPAEDTSQGGLFTQFVETNLGSALQRSTITASEKAAFDRIFREISADTAKKTNIEEDFLDDAFEDDVKSKSETYGDLNAIFDEALVELTRKSESAKDVSVDEKASNLPAQNYATAISPTGTRFLNLSEMRVGKDIQPILEAVSDHRARVMKMFDEASTDMEIWRVMDTEVFTLVNQYNTLREKTREREEAKKPKRKKGRVSKADQEAAAGAEQSHGLRATKQGAQEAQIQAILSSNYGDYCLAAMRHLRRAFPTSPYCMNMLPQIKRLGPISHVLAVSVDLYNEILFLLWKEYSDLHSMADLIIEMGNQGIESNELTLRVLTMVRRARRNAMAEDLPMKLWWDMRPVETGWQRLKAEAKKMRQEIAQARIRRSIKERELRNGMDEEGVLPGTEDSPEGIESGSETRLQRATAD
ncbi:MAG: hypothetical protein Q9219_001017 [cf. Caloplaca sp. 3 TL-2023]